MGEFRRSYAQHDGKETIRKVFREHIVTSTALTACAVGLKRKGLEILQLELNHKIGCRIEKRFRSQVEALRAVVEAEYEATTSFKDQRVWSLWLQGEENAPNIVRKCLSSVRDHVGVDNHVILSSNNLQEFITLPEAIMRKHRDGKICDANFSDLIRLELLARYGGIWADATIFFSDTPPSFQTDAPLFLFQTLPPGSSGETIPVSSWYIASQRPSRILLMTRALLFAYWEEYDHAIDYFMFHFFFMMATRAYPEEWAAVIPCSNEAPQILASVLLDEYDEGLFKAVKQQTSIHKLTYKIDTSLSAGVETFYAKLFH